MQAILLAGGFGTRLKPVIGGDIPKPMAPVAGEPFLAHYLRYLKTQGVTEAMLSVHHLAEPIRAYFKDRFEGMPIRYAQEETPLGTGGAVKFALACLRPESPVLVVNGDSFVEVDVAGMHAAHAASGATLTMALREMPDCSRYGEVHFDTLTRRIASFRYPGDAAAGWISTGTYLVSPEIFNSIPLPESFSFEADFQRAHVAEAPLFAWPMHGCFLDIGVPEDYARAETELKPHLEKLKNRG